MQNDGCLHKRGADGAVAGDESHHDQGRRKVTQGEGDALETQTHRRPKVERQLSVALAGD